MYDVIIIGGGPAGLSAGLILGRSRRKVLICDSGEPRNKRAEQMHGYLTRDGLNPLDFIQLGREELLKYDVLVESRKIVEVNYADKHFEVIDSSDEKFYSKKILIATGIADNLPDIPGLESMYGKSVFHCPYCDGWEVRDKKLAALANGKAAYVLGFSIKTWSSDVIICTDGISSMRKIDTEKLLSAGIKIYTQKIERLEG